jgi:hypothetical protein
LTTIFRRGFWRQGQHISILLLAFFSGWPGLRRFVLDLGRTQTTDSSPEKGFQLNGRISDQEVKDLFLEMFGGHLEGHEGYGQWKEAEQERGR